jgi:hypothetical protein
MKNSPSGHANRAEDDYKIECHWATPFVRVFVTDDVPIAIVENIECFKLSGALSDFSQLRVSTWNAIDANQITTYG